MRTPHFHVERTRQRLPTAVGLNDSSRTQSDREPPKWDAGKECPMAAVIFRRQEVVHKAQQRCFASAVITVQDDDLTKVASPHVRAESITIDTKEAIYLDLLDCWWSFAGVEMQLQRPHFLS